MTSLHGDRPQASLPYQMLTHWGRVMHICVGEQTIIGSDNGLSLGRCQAIIWTNAGILPTGPLGTNFSDILIEMNTFSFKKMHLKMPSGKWWPSCLGLNQSNKKTECMLAVLQFLIAWGEKLAFALFKYSHIIMKEICWLCTFFGK